MLQHLKELAVRILMITLLLVMLSLLISYAARNSGLSFKDVLFWVGTAPLALFSIRMFGTLSGRVTRKSKDTSASTRRPAEQQLTGRDSSVSKRTSSGFAWAAAGLLVWLLAYLV